MNILEIAEAFTPPTLPPRTHPTPTLSHPFPPNYVQEFDGSDAGARPDEAVSWGKIKLDSAPVKIYAEATLVFPLLVAQTFASNWEARPDDAERIATAAAAARSDIGLPEGVASTSTDAAPTPAN